MEQNREIDQFKRQCSSRLADIYFHLFPAGKVIGTEFVIGDLDGSRGQSVSFSLDPSKNGVGGEFNTSDKNRMFSDFIEVWKYKKDVNFVEAVEDIGKFLGINNF